MCHGHDKSQEMNKNEWEDTIKKNMKEDFERKISAFCLHLVHMLKSPKSETFMSSLYSSFGKDRNISYWFSFY